MGWKWGSIFHSPFPILDSRFTIHETSPFTVGWAGVKPIGSAAYPLRAKRPRNPVMSKDKIKRIFGIEMPDWTEQLQACLSGLSTNACVSDRVAR